MTTPPAEIPALPPLPDGLPIFGFDTVVEKMTEYAEAARAPLLATIEAQRQEIEQLRRHIDKRAAGVDPLTQHLRERTERAEAELTTARQERDALRAERPRMLLYGVAVRVGQHEIIVNPDDKLASTGTPVYTPFAIDKAIEQEKGT